MAITETWQDAYHAHDYTDGEPPTLALTDRAGADRHLAAIARLEAEHELEKAGALAEVERIQQWIRGRYEAMWEQTKWHREVLHRYHEAVLAVDPRLKTIKLPHGELQARAQQPSWEIDGPTFLKWAQENLPEAVRPAKPTEPTVDVAAAKRLLTVTRGDDREAPCGPLAVTADGVVAQGVSVVHRPPKFSIAIGADEPEPLIAAPPPGYAQPAVEPGQSFATEDLTPEQLAHVAAVAKYVADVAAEEAADQANAMADQRDAWLDRAENDADDHASAMADARDYIESVAGEPF